MINSQELANSIKEIAKSKKIAIGKMLSDCGLSVNTLSSMQSGGYYPRLEAIAKIADYLNVSVDYLLGKSEQKEKPSTDDEELNRLLKITDNLSDENLQKLLDYGNLLLKSQD